MTRTPRLFALGAVLGLALAVLLADPSPLLTAWRDRLERWEELPQKADALFLLLGDVAPRAMYAAMLVREGRAPLVAMATPTESAPTKLGLYPREDEVACRILATLGVADSCVVVLPGRVESTYEEALEAAAWAESLGLGRIIFVTSSYHSARAAWILRRVVAPRGILVHVAAVPHPDVDFVPWWRNEDGLVTVFNETVKTLHYRITYRRVA